MATYDVIVIGAGHNGLTAAALLAKRGRKVIVLEKRDTIGGLAEVLHDTSCVRRDVVDTLGLASHGLEFEAQGPSVFAAGESEGGLLLEHDVDRAAGEIAKHSEKDADAYREFRGFLDRVGGFVRAFLNERPPDLTNPSGDKLGGLKKAMSLRRLGKRDMMEFIRVSAMPVADWLNERFETDLLKASLAMPAIQGAFMGPRSPWSSFNLIMWECRRSNPVKGGAAALISTLEKTARAHAVEIRSGANVVKIRADRNGVKGVTLTGDEEIDGKTVVASCDPKTTFGSLVGSRRIPQTLEKRIGQYRSYGVVAKVAVEPKGPVGVKGPADRRVDFVRLAPDLNRIEQAFDAVKYDTVSERPVIEACLTTNDQPAVSALVYFAPYRLNGGWDERKRDTLGKHVVGALANHMSGLDGASCRVLTPVDIEAEYGVSGGHVFHGDHVIDQILIRPTPECVHNGTPIAGLFLCGSGSFPGGGLTCGPGSLGASAVEKG